MARLSLRVFAIALFAFTCKLSYSYTLRLPLHSTMHRGGVVRSDHKVINLYARRNKAANEEEPQAPPVEAANSPTAAVAGAAKKVRKRRAIPVFNVTSTASDSDKSSPNSNSSSSNGVVAFVVYGEPVPLSRHMVARGHMYNPSAPAQKLFASACEAFLPATPLQGPLEATLIFHFSRPKTHFFTDKKRMGQLRPTADHWHSKRKDLDNLIKFVLDSLNAKAYVDDAQICVIKSAKYYTNDHEPRTVVRIRALKDTVDL